MNEKLRKGLSRIAGTPKESVVGEIAKALARAYRGARPGFVENPMSTADSVECAAVLHGNLFLELDEAQKYTEFVFGYFAAGVDVTIDGETERRFPQREEGRRRYPMFRDFWAKDVLWLWKKTVGLPVWDFVAIHRLASEKFGKAAGEGLHRLAALWDAHEDDERIDRSPRLREYFDWLHTDREGFPTMRSVAYAAKLRVFERRLEARRRKLDEEDAAKVREEERVRHEAEKEERLAHDAAFEAEFGMPPTFENIGAVYAREIRLDRMNAEREWLAFRGVRDDVEQARMERIRARGRASLADPDHEKKLYEARKARRAGSDRRSPT